LEGVRAALVELEGFSVLEAGAAVAMDRESMYAIAVWATECARAWHCRQVYLSIAKSSKQASKCGSSTSSSCGVVRKIGGRIKSVNAEEKSASFLTCK